MAVPKPEEKRRVFERLASIREVVFGIQDGVLTTAGVLAGLSGAVSGRSQVILAARTQAGLEEVADAIARACESLGRASLPPPIENPAAAGSSFLQIQSDAMR